MYEYLLNFLGFDKVNQSSRKWFVSLIFVVLVFIGIFFFKWSFEPGVIRATQLENSKSVSFPGTLIFLSEGTRVGGGGHFLLS